MGGPGLEPLTAAHILRVRTNCRGLRAAGCGPAVARLWPSRRRNALSFPASFSQCPLGWPLCLLSSPDSTVWPVNFGITSPAGFPLPSGQFSSWAFRGLRRRSQPTSPAHLQPPRPSPGGRHAPPRTGVRVTKLSLCSDQAVLPPRPGLSSAQPCSLVQRPFLPEISFKLSLTEKVPLSLCVHCVRASDHRRSLLNHVLR